MTDNDITYKVAGLVRSSLYNLIDCMDQLNKVMDRITEHEGAIILDDDVLVELKHIQALSALLHNGVTLQLGALDDSVVH